MSFTQFFMRERKSNIFGVDILQQTKTDPFLFNMVLGEPSINRLRELARGQADISVFAADIPPELLAEVQAEQDVAVAGPEATAERLAQVKAEGFTTLTAPLNPQFKKAGLKKKKKKNNGS